MVVRLGSCRQPGARTHTVTHPLMCVGARGALCCWAPPHVWTRDKGGWGRSVPLQLLDLAVELACSSSAEAVHDDEALAE